MAARPGIGPTGEGRNAHTAMAPSEKVQPALQSKPVPAQAGGEGGTAVSNQIASGDGRAETAFHEIPKGWAVLGVVWVISAAYLLLLLKEGWVPSDAGMLGESARRVLQGQVPYRDFIEVYTGGLDYLNALAFRLFGTSLFSLRIPLYLFFLGWVPSVYFISRRFMGPIGAGLVTLLSVAWSVPNYPEAMPSWYNLFFATWGVLALARYIETEKRRWIWTAGFCTGLSFLVKITALYFVAAALLFFVFREISISRRSPKSPARRVVSYRIFASIGLFLFLTVLVGLISQRPTGLNFLYFVLPAACLVFALLWSLWRTHSAGSGARFRLLFSMVLPFLGGVAVPVAIFLTFYIKAGAIQAWATGVLRASVRSVWVASSPFSAILAGGLVPAAFILAQAFNRRQAVRRWNGWFAVVACLGGLIFASRYATVYSVIGQSLQLLVPALAAAVFLLCFSGRGSHGRGQLAVLVLAAAILCSLVQFPFAFPIYFCYVAPLVFLTVACSLSALGKPDRLAVGAVVIFYIVFAVWLRTPGFFSTDVLKPDQAYSLTRMDIPRAGGLVVKTADAAQYDKLTRAVEEHAGGHFIFCTPDCPEVYFLSGLRNPTPTIYDFLDPDFLTPDVRDERIFASLKAHNVREVVIGLAGSIGSGTVLPGLRAALDSRFPESERVGDFEVRWK